jgi:hypothetical protein
VVFTLDQPWAIRAALRNRFGWIFEGQQTPPQLLVEDFASSEEIQIRFVTPTKREPIDITPPAPDPYAGQQPDYSKPALPSPPQRERTPFGALFEKPDPKGWMK